MTTQYTISFNVTTAEAKQISAIARRAIVQLARVGETGYSLMDAEMDITAVHCSGCRLRLRELLKADDLNFAHDVFGIKRHLDRETGKLLHHFHPRFAEGQ